MKRFFRIDHKGTARHVVEEQGKWRLVEGDIFASYEAGAEVTSTGQYVLALVTPSKIVAVGLNYKDHAAEQNKPLPSEPMIFLKPSTAVIGPDEPIVLPEGVGRVDHEGFDTFAPIGPCMASGLDYNAPGGIGVEGWVNDDRRQASSTRELIFSIDRLIAFISAVMTLLPGDIVFTGTPAGVGPIQPGDRVSIKVSGVGELSNPVRQGIEWRS